MSTVKVTQKRNNSTEITISGELNIYSVMENYQKYFQTVKFKEQVILKLSGIEEVDTAGMQLLVVLFKAIEQQGSTYLIQTTSDSINEYSKLFNLKHYFKNNDNKLLLEDK